MYQKKHCSETLQEKNTERFETPIGVIKGYIRTQFYLFIAAYHFDTANKAVCDASFPREVRVVIGSTNEETFLEVKLFGRSLSMTSIKQQNTRTKINSVYQNKVNTKMESEKFICLF